MNEAATFPASVLLVGAGRMGGALLTGWRDHVPVAVLDPNFQDAPGIQRINDPAQLSTMPGPRLVVLAVKPGLVSSVAAQFARFADERTLFLSVAAGVRVETLRQSLGAQALIARAMPNIAVACGAGAVAIYFDKAVPETERARAEALFNLVGEVVSMTSEALIDIATAVAGSGPAFFFRFAEALADAGRSAGLPEEQARLLASATLRGAGALCGGTQSLKDLREMVTSPGGTTAAGLAALDQDRGIEWLAGRAVEAAVHRAKELSQ